jgi:hypothetical protein
MNQATLSGLIEELQHIGMRKVAIDPVATGALLAVAKLNLMRRFAHKIPGIRNIATEAAGIGARTALQGKPMMSAPLRHVTALVTDPAAVKAYELGYSAASKLGPNTPAALRELRALTRDFEPVHGLTKVPLESRGLRKAIDYAFTPVSHVARDLRAPFRRSPVEALGSPAALPSVG